MKRLLCFFDGTWNVPDGRADVTNVVKLARVTLGTAPDGVPQVSRYVEGIGTDPGDGEYEAFLEGAIGVGVDRRIVEGYRFLSEHYDPGDEIYLFGFSRGAFQARSLSELVTLVGLLQPDALNEAGEAWNYYQAHKVASDPSKLERLRKLGYPDVRIRCVGVWDTVGNLGIPLVGGWIGPSISFHSTELSPLVDVGLQALAIDEPRGPFNPSLWTRKKGAALPSGQHIEQVWFPGSHANIGGGFPETSLSDIALIWMAERAMATTGVAFDLARLRKLTKVDPLGELVSPTSDGIYRVSRLLPFVRLIRQSEAGISPFRRAVLGTWRTSRLDDGLVTVGESIHPAALERLGKPGRFRLGDDARRVVYLPRSLEKALEEDDRRT